MRSYRVRVPLGISWHSSKTRSPGCCIFGERDLDEPIVIEVSNVPNLVRRQRLQNSRGRLCCRQPPIADDRSDGW